MPQSPDEFAVLVDAARNGEQIAFAVLLRPYEASLRKASLGLLGPHLRRHVDSDDLLQDAILALWLGLTRRRFDFATPSEMLALLRCLLQRAAARLWRKVRRTCRVEARYAIISSCATTCGTPHDADPPSLLAEAEATELLLAGLDRKDSRLLRLRIEGFTTAQAACHLGLRAGSCRQRLLRLRKRMKLRLDFEQPWSKHRPDA